MSRFLLLVLCTAALGAHAAEPVVAIARFVCDDKQATADTCDEPAWRRSALEGPEKSSTLFEHVWGGPEGAVWNGAAAIVLFVKGSSEVVTLNGVKLAMTRSGAWRWGRVSAAQWQKWAKPVPEHAYEQVTVRVGKQVVGAWWFAYGE